MASSAQNSRSVCNCFKISCCSNIELPLLHIAAFTHVLVGRLKGFHFLQINVAIFVPHYFTLSLNLKQLTSNSRCYAEKRVFLSDAPPSVKVTWIKVMPQTGLHVNRKHGVDIRVASERQEAAASSLTVEGTRGRVAKRQSDTLPPAGERTMDAVSLDCMDSWFHL